MVENLERKSLLTHFYIITGYNLDELYIAVPHRFPPKLITLDKDDPDWGSDYNCVVKFEDALKYNNHQKYKVHALYLNTIEYYGLDKDYFKE